MRPLTRWHHMLAEKVIAMPYDYLIGFVFGVLIGGLLFAKLNGYDD